MIVCLHVGNSIGMKNVDVDGRDEKLQQADRQEAGLGISWSKEQMLEVLDGTFRVWNAKKNVSREAARAARTLGMMLERVRSHAKGGGSVQAQSHARVQTQAQAHVQAQSGQGGGGGGIPLSSGRPSFSPPIASIPTMPFINPSEGTWDTTSLPSATDYMTDSGSAEFYPSMNLEENSQFDFNWVRVNVFLSIFSHR